MRLPAAVLEVCGDLGLGQPVDCEALDGGIICRTRRVRTDAGSTLVVKEAAGVAADFFPLEATMLDAIRQPGWTVPAVLAATAECLVLEDLGQDNPRADDYWERLGRAWAGLHERTSERFGWSRDLYYGTLLSDNAWRADGYAFYADTRFLPWLSRPRCAAVLDAEDRRRLERVATRLPALIPLQGPSLMHGDLWCGNLLVDAAGGPAVIDPSPHYGWPEADLHNAQMFGGFDDRFFDAYRECHPLEPGWRERLELLYLPHLLGMIEHDCDVAGSLAWTRRLLARFA